jgi:trigger factor
LLKVATDSLENCEVLMTVEVDEEQTDKLLKAAAQRISKQVKIPGFRPGKAPYRMVVQRFGEDAVRDEALEELSKSVFQEALKQAELEPYAPAAMEEISWAPLVMKVRVPTAPVVELGDYRALRLETEPVEVSQAEIDQALAGMQKEYAEWNPVERPAQPGDAITMAAKERAGDELLAENEHVEYELAEVSPGSPGPDLTTPLLGLAAGDQKEFTVTYPPDAQDPRYAGREVTITVKVHGVKEKKLYPLDDDFAQMVGDFDSLEQITEKLSQNIRQQKQREADEKLGQEALKQVVEAAIRLEWPKVMEEEEIDAALNDQDRQLRKSGLNLDTYLSMQKKTRDQLRAELRQGAQERLRRALVLSKLIELENLSVAGHEVSGQINRLSMLAGERGDALRQALTTPDSVRYIANDLLTAKVIERLAQIVKGQAEAVQGGEETTESSQETAEGGPEIVESSQA